MTTTATRNLAGLCAAAMIFAAGLATMPARADERAAPLAGITNFTFDAPHRQRLVQATIWYPASRGRLVEKIGANAVFKGTLAYRDAIPDGARHPLIVFSHGSGGSPATLAWLAQRLSVAGFIVALPTHQGTTSADSTPEQTVNVGERTEDMSKLLDALLASPAMAGMIDANDVTAMGFSLGGHTALSLVGASAVAADYADFCDTHAASLDCVWFAKGAPGIPGHVDLRAIDGPTFGAKHTDRRVKRFVAIDPAFAQAYDAASLQAISMPGLVLSMGSGDEIAATVRPDRLMANMRNAQFESVKGANHFSFLSECTPLANLWIWMEGEDPICRERGDRGRADLHAEMAQKILQFLKSVTKVAVTK